MKCFKKAFFLAMGISFVLINNIACTQESDKTQPNLEVMATKSPSEVKAEPSTPSASTAKVFTIESVSKAEKGKAVNFTWKDGSKSVKYSDIAKGKVVFLNFWGTWCPPCRREIPDIVEIAKDLAKKDFVVIGIPLEKSADQAVTNVKNFAEKNGIQYINVIDLKRQLDEAYGGISGVPTTFIIDKKGNITETIVGMRDKATFMQYINKVLK